MCSYHKRKKRKQKNKVLILFMQFEITFCMCICMYGLSSCIYMHVYKCDKHVKVQI